jgi:hypothetical protein
MPEEYNEYGEIKPKRMSFDQEHRIHMTKDIFDGECSLCQIAMKKKIKTYWSDDE